MLISYKIINSKINKNILDNLNSTCKKLNTKKQLLNIR